LRENPRMARCRRGGGAEPVNENRWFGIRSVIS
jgi:hypothetical protein